MRIVVALSLVLLGCGNLPSSPDPVAFAASSPHFVVPALEPPAGINDVIGSKLIVIGPQEYQAVYYTIGGQRTGKRIPSGITWDVDNTAFVGFVFLPDPDGVVRGDRVQIPFGSLRGTFTLRAAVTLQSRKVWDDTLVVSLH